MMGMTFWAIGALFFDLPNVKMRTFAAAFYAAVMFGAMAFVKGRLRRVVVLVFAGFLAVLSWWFTIKPSNDRKWPDDVARTPYAEVNGDIVTLHNVRHFTYGPEDKVEVRWEERTVDLSQLRGADIAINYWGSPWIAHPIVSFQFGENDHLAFSIETRKEVGEEYSAIKGFYRQYELIYIIGDERDLLRVRTNVRKENVYLYHTNSSVEHARFMFLDYLRRANMLNKEAEFYNAVTSNCTTNIRTQSVIKNPWDWRILINGFMDEMLFQRGDLATGGLSFSELKKQALIDEVAQTTDTTSDFSSVIREGRTGF